MIEFYPCPYCKPFWKKGQNKKVPGTVGKYKIKNASESVLILECQKCMKVHRIRMMGSPLLWEDMTLTERRVFNQKGWVKYVKEKE